MTIAVFSIRFQLFHSAAVNASALQQYKAGISKPYRTREVFSLKVIVLRMIQFRKRGRRGQGMVEYALIIGFVAILFVAVLRMMPMPLEVIFEDAAAALGAGTP